jgi:hypothetical protein
MMFVDDIMKRKYNSYKVNELGRTKNLKTY